MAMPYKPSWVATFSARDNSKKHGSGLASFLPLPTSSLVNANRMQMPCIMLTNSTQSITTSPPSWRTFLLDLGDSLHTVQNYLYTSLSSMLLMRSMAREGQGFCGTYSQQSVDTT